MQEQLIPFVYLQIMQAVYMGVLMKDHPALSNYRMCNHEIKPQIGF